MKSEQVRNAQMTLATLRKRRTDRTYSWPYYLSTVALNLSWLQVIRARERRDAATRG